MHLKLKRTWQAVEHRNIGMHVAICVRCETVSSFCAHKSHRRGHCLSLSVMFDVRIDTFPASSRLLLYTNPQERLGWRNRLCAPVLRHGRCRLALLPGVAACEALGPVGGGGQVSNFGKRSIVFCRGLFFIEREHGLPQ